MTTVSVTAGHLSLGIPGDCGKCPVALAIEDAFPHAIGVSVGDRYISMCSEGAPELLIIPESVRALIADIDTGTPVDPFTFELDYPAVTR